MHKVPTCPPLQVPRSSNCRRGNACSDPLTGDLGWKVPHGVPGSNMGGMIQLSGRSKDTIVMLNGKNISPQPIEDMVRRRGGGELWGLVDASWPFGVEGWRWRGEQAKPWQLCLEGEGGQPGCAAANSTLRCTWLSRAQGSA